MPLQLLLVINASSSSSSLVPEPEVPTWRQGPERLTYSAEVPHSPARFAVHGLPGAQELPGRPYLRHAPGDFQGVDGEPPGRLPPSGSHAELDLSLY